MLKLGLRVYGRSVDASVCQKATPPLFLYYCCTILEEHHHKGEHCLSIGTTRLLDVYDVLLEAFAGWGAPFVCSETPRRPEAERGGAYGRFCSRGFYGRRDNHLVSEADK